MAIVIPSKSEKQASQLRDAIRILAWAEFKASNESDLKGLDLYDLFKKEWLEHEIHSMNLSQIVAFAKDLDYSPTELMNLRAQYYANKKSYSNSSDSSSSNYSNEEAAF